MARNPKNPRLYTTAPRERAKEKLDLILKIMVDFHHSTRELLLQRLNLATHSHHRYFATLEEKGILKRIESPSIRSNFIYMLTHIGAELAAEKLAIATHYQLNGHKINHNNLRHDLAIQKAVITRINDYDDFIPEKFLPSLNINDEKRPDGCFLKDKEKTMLEVELTAKTDHRIYRAFISHAKAIIKKHYNNVLYVFPNKSIKKYYLERFNEKTWPCYHQNDRKNWVKEDEEFNSYNHINLRKSFLFIVDEDLTKSF